MARARVVVIEDEIEVAATILEQLTARDYEVRTATTAQEGLDVMKPSGRTCSCSTSHCPGSPAPGS